MAHEKKYDDGRTAKNLQKLIIFNNAEKNHPRHCHGWFLLHQILRIFYNRVIVPPLQSKPKTNCLILQAY